MLEAYKELTSMRSKMPLVVSNRGFFVIGSSMVLSPLLPRLSWRGCKKPYPYPRINYCNAISRCV